MDLEPDTATNAAPEGRAYVLLLDSESTIAPPMGTEILLRTKLVARQFLSEAVRPGDQVAVVHAQGSNTDGQGFTSSRALVDRAIDRFGRGRSGPIDWTTRPGDPSVEIERVRRTLVTYRTLQDVAERLGSVGGRRKVIVWIGGQIDTQPERHMASDSNSPIAASAGILHAALRDALQAAARNNVAVYPVDPVGLTPAMGQGELIRMSSLRSIAEDTGGIATVNSNNYADAYAAIVRDASTYYLLGYSPDRDHPQDGSFHPISVRVKRPDVTVRARAADGLSAYAEVYTYLRRNISDAESVRVKVATLTGTITTADGTFVSRSQSGRVTVDADRSALREGFRTDFDLSRVAPGAYVLTLEARSSETGGRVARRQIPFTVVE